MIKNKILSVIAAMSLAATSFASLAVTAGAADGVWKKASLDDIRDGDTVVFTMTASNGSVYGLPHAAATGAPTAAKLAISSATGELIDGNAAVGDCTWTVGRDGDTLTFTSAADNKNTLYCNNTNNGVRVGAGSNSSFTIADGYLYNSGTKRYIGVYNGQDWRCYTTVNDNIKDQTLRFWKLGTPTAAVYAKKASLGDIRDGDTVIFTMTTGNGSVYGLPHAATASAPAVAGLAVSSAGDKLIDATAAVADCTWTVSRDGNALTFTSAADNKNTLYCNNTNNGVRVGAGSEISFTVSGGYLYNSGTKRYLGVYNGQDWRCYTTVNDNIKGQELQFWKLIEPAEATYAQVGDDYEAQFDGDKAASLWKVTVTPGGDAIKTLSVEVNGIQPEKPLKSDTAFSGAGSIVFGVVLNGTASDFNGDFKALVNGEAVATTAE